MEEDNLQDWAFSTVQDNYLKMNGLLNNWELQKALLVKVSLFKVLVMSDIGHLNSLLKKVLSL